MGYNILKILIIFAVYILAIRTYLRWKANNPSSYADYLHKLSIITKKHEYDFFIIAGEDFKIRGSRVLKDYNRFLTSFGKNKLVPQYVKIFIDNGKEKLDKIRVPLFF